MEIRCKKDNSKVKEDKNIHEKQRGAFILGVHDTFKLKDSDDLVVVGRVKGKVSVGDAVYCSNPGEDND